MRAFTLIGILLGGSLLVAPRSLAQEAASPGDDERRTVTVEAEGYNKDDAVRQALRKALEQGAGVWISSQSEVRNFELLRDTIYSMANGIVTDYQILDQREVAGGTWKARIRATVSRSTVVQQWGEIRATLEQMGNPRIMILIDERIDERPQPASIVERRIAEMFTKAGFNVMSRTGFNDQQRREADAALIKGDDAKLQQLAKDIGAHVYIRGYARADWAGLREVFGNPVAFYNCTVMAEAYRTDTNTMLASESIPARERGVRGTRTNSPQAAMQALVAATFPDTDRREPVLAIKLFESVMEKWAREIGGGGEIVFEVERMDFANYVRLRRALEQLRGIQSVHGDFSDGYATYRLTADINAQTFAELLLDPPLSELVEVRDVKPNRVRAAAVRAN
ncbi:MAG: hypothetical protein IPM18_11890 [Phycisphaerales bacterium]|nr:hypothetical protein [Phycisphaerales bacterium]